MARIPFPDPATLSPEISDRLVRMGSLNVTRMMTHAPDLMVAYSRLGTYLLARGVLDPVLREVLILRVGQLMQSDYEWHQHESLARAVGMPPAMLQKIAAQDFAALPERERAAIAIVEGIHADGAASQDAVTRALTHFSSAELVEICILTGFYILTAGYLRTLDIEIEDTPPLGDRIMATAGSAPAPMLRR